MRIVWFAGGALVGFVASEAEAGCKICAGACELVVSVASMLLGSLRNTMTCCMFATQAGG